MAHSSPPVSRFSALAPRLASFEKLCNWSVNLHAAQFRQKPVAASTISLSPELVTSGAMYYFEDCG
jgi:hypothetical protein